MIQNKISPQTKLRHSANKWWLRSKDFVADHWLVSLCSLLIFLIPSNLFLVLHEQSGYANGLRIDYLIPKLYLSNLVAICFMCATFFVAKSRRTKWTILLGIGWLLLLTRQFFAPNPVSSLWFFAELTLAGGVIWSVTKIPKQVITNRLITWSLAVLLSLQSLVAIGQFVSQKSLFGYWFFGETNLLQYSGIATQILFNREFILPSGTTAHPNVLAGILVIGCVFLWQRRNDVSRLFLFSTILLSVIGLTLTFSASAWLAGALVLIFLLWNKRLDATQKRISLISLWMFAVIIPLGIAQLSEISTNPSLVRRAALNKVAIEQFVQQPIWGTGLNSFTRNLAAENTNKDLERFIQPAHNAPLLMLAETGLLGVLGACFFWLWLRKQPIPTEQLLLVGCVLVPLLSLDHYLYTIESGRLALLLALFIVLPVKESA